MTSEFQHYFIEEIKKVSNDNKHLVSHIAQILQQKNAGIYKKLKAETPFSMNDVWLIAQHFGISLDRFIHHRHAAFGKVLVDYSFSKDFVQTPIGFLEKIRTDLEQIVQLPHPKVMYATNEMPLFHSLTCPELMAFKLFIWCKTNWQLPETEGERFDTEAFYAQWPGLDEHRIAIMELYDRIPGCEYWPRTVLDNMLNQIRYYAGAHYFADPNTPHRLHEELTVMLESRKKIAEAGQKGLGGSGGAAVKMFLNETAYTNNIILIKNEDTPIAVYATMDNPNFLRSSDPVFCRRMHQWVNQVEEVSFNLSNEFNRESLFGELAAKIRKNDAFL